jgi:hypothetical protein
MLLRWSGGCFVIAHVLCSRSSADTGLSSSSSGTLQQITTVLRLRQRKLDGLAISTPWSQRMRVETPRFPEIGTKLSSHSQLPKHANQLEPKIQTWVSSPNPYFRSRYRSVPKGPGPVL